MRVLGRDFSVKSLRVQLLKWLIYNLLIFPVVAVFYVPYNLIWLQFNSLQIIRWFLTAGLASAAVNVILRPWNAWVSRFIEKRFSAPKAPVVEGPNEEGIFQVIETENEKK